MHEAGRTGEPTMPCVILYVYRAYVTSVCRNGRQNFPRPRHDTNSFSFLYSFTSVTWQRAVLHSLNTYTHTPSESRKKCEREREKHVRCHSPKSTQKSEMNWKQCVNAQRCVAENTTGKLKLVMQMTVIFILFSLSLSRLLRTPLAVWFRWRAFFLRRFAFHFHSFSFSFQFHCVTSVSSEKNLSDKLCARSF